MGGIITLSFLLALFGIGGIIFSLVGSFLTFSFKVLTGSIMLLLILLCGIPLLLAGLFFGGLALLF